jgi:hypothetical protein
LFRLSARSSPHLSLTEFSDLTVTLSRIEPLHIRHFIAAALALYVTPVLADPKSDGFRKLSGPAIKQAFSGHTFSDEVHFAFRYTPTGDLEGMGMGSKVSRKWRILKDELCVTDSVGENCYAVWRKGPEVKLIMEDSDLSLDGLLK